MLRTGKRELMIVAGEASGDELGAELARDLLKLQPDIVLFGAAGPRMRVAGVEPVLESDTWSIVGLTAVAKAVPKFLRIKSELRRIARSRKPEAVVLIDFPEFNLKLARELKADGHRVIYYVSPQLWAWRRYRYKTIRDSVDLLLSILPFEKEWYRKFGIEHVEYVGNPVVQRCDTALSREQFCLANALNPNCEIVALLPGSRRKEIIRHLEPMLNAAAIVYENRPSVSFVIAANNTENRDLCESIVRNWASTRSLELPIKTVAGDAANALNAARVAAVSSGTATLEAGVIGTPMAVIYKIPKVDAVIFKPLVKVPHFALINLVAGKRIVTELIQAEFTAENLAAELIRLSEPSANAEVKLQLAEATQKLRGSSDKCAAEAILDFLGSDLAAELHS